MPRSTLFVALHDLTLSRWQECRWAMELFAEFGMSSPGLALIPHLDGPEHLNVDFQNWCHSLGPDVVWLLHGHRHLADLSLKRSWLGKQLQKICQGEAEFAGLNHADLDLVLGRSIQAGEGWNLDFQGFVPPTWHAPKALKNRVFALNLSIYESRFFVSTQTDKFFSFPLSFPSAASDAIWLKSLSAALSLAKWTPLNLRLVLHPGDLSTEFRREKLRDLMTHLVLFRDVASYPKTRLLSTCRV